MGNLKLWIPPAWANALRHDPAIKKAVKEAAEGIAERAGEGFEVIEKPTRVRYRCIVMAGTYKAYRKNLKENTLLKAVKP